MKKISLLIVFIFTLIAQVFLGCSKNNPNDPTIIPGDSQYSLIGIWIQNGDIEYSFNNDGTFVRKSMGVNDFKGTWTVVDNETINISCLYVWNAGAWVLQGTASTEQMSYLIIDNGNTLLEDVWKRTAGTSGIVGTWIKQSSSWTNGVLEEPGPLSYIFGSTTNYTYLKNSTPFEEGTGSYVLSGSNLIMNRGSGFETNIFFELGTGHMVIGGPSTSCLLDLKFIKQ